MAGVVGNNVTININSLNLIAVSGISGTTQTMSINVKAGMTIYTRFNIVSNNYAGFRQFTYQEGIAKKWKI